ncbi:MAG: phosphoribosylamine--glycine ligase [Hyphomicrobium sp.]
MHVLLIGSGGREHALAWKLAKSPLLSKLTCAPGNPGIAEFANCVGLESSDHASVISFCRDHGVNFVIVGPEAPLVGGLTDALSAARIKHFGPSQKAAILEGSKGFTKDLCRENNIPTAAYSKFKNRDAALAYVKNQKVPIVIKADGLSAGKGVVIASSTHEAISAVNACFNGSFGSAGHEVVIEEFLEGEEASFFALCDGNYVVPFGTAQDHKRVGDGDTGPNTGGMGAYSPAPIMTQETVKRTMQEIIIPTVHAMKNRGTPFMGVLFAGLMITSDGPKLIEYNVRFGDPETQVLMMRLKSDLLEVLLATADGKLHTISPDWTTEASLTVVFAARGYPGTPHKGSVISNIKGAKISDNVEIFHAGTKKSNHDILADGGRVLNVTARGQSVAEAQLCAYAAIKKIEWPEGFYRHDIGWRAIERERAKIRQLL